MDADADRVTPYVFWQLSPDDDHYVDVLHALTYNEHGHVSSGSLLRHSARDDCRSEISYICICSYMYMYMIEKE